MIKAANDLLAAEQTLSKIRSFADDLETIEQRMKGWAELAQTSLGAVVGTADKSVSDAFLARLRQHLLALGCAGVTAGDASQVYLDEHYLPTLRQRWVRSLGSASDRARLIVAYTLALAETGKHHPGLVAYDEPLQQNPDPGHRERFIRFLVERGAAIDRQVLVFTSFYETEEAQLRAAGISVQTVDGKFLQPAREP
jgi:hypothetical protein